MFFISTCKGLKNRALGRESKKTDEVYIHDTGQHYTFFKDMHKKKISTKYMRMVADGGEGHGNLGVGPKENKEGKARGRREEEEEEDNEEEEKEDREG